MRHASVGGSNDLEIEVRPMIAGFLQGGGLTVGDIERATLRRMTPEEALKRLEGKLPANVTQLLHMASDSKSARKLEEKDMERAMYILNGMVEDAWERMDKIIDDCKMFEARNRGTWDQVMADLDRIASQISDLEGERDDATSCISDMDDQREELTEIHEKEQRVYMRERLENEKELRLRENERNVWNFMMQVTKCGGAAVSFAQESLDSSAHTPSLMSFCQTGDRDFNLVFSNINVQKQLESVMTPRVRRELSAMIESLQSGGRVGALLLQNRTDVPPHSNISLIRTAAVAQATTTVQTTSAFAALPTVALPTIAIEEKPNPKGQWRKCVDGKPNCGLLHDTISLEWGGYRDQVDELKDTMQQNEDAWKKVVDNFNEQLRIIRTERERCTSRLSAATSQLNLDNIEKKEKEQEERELTREFDREMAKCKAQIEEILFTFICAVRKTRNELMKQSTLIPVSSIIDCDVADWVPGACSVDCDDNCPNKVDPWACGGTHTLTRELVQQANQYGIKCPSLTTQRTCNQKKCPVDCLMSQWSGWSACSKECEGGVQGQTRSILTKTKNGGKACDTPAESRPCNTMSCDRDCLLFDWTNWSPCSMACGGGLTHRNRHVDIPTRGNGKCPREDALGLRLQEKKCNEQPCVGDEVCIANMDLILAIDASGSLRESGFDLVRDFAYNLTGRYLPRYFGRGAMQVGVVQFGNGLVAVDGTITPALSIQPLTSDMEVVREKIKELTWQKGFTNMAQALISAETMLQHGGRADAQSAVMVLSDGKPSLIFSTTQKVKKLKEANVQLFMAPIMDNEGEEMHQMEEWASQPWETNLVHIPGLAALKSDFGLFVEQLVSTFCAHAISPTRLNMEETNSQYILLKEGYWPNPKCNRVGVFGTGLSLEQCANLAKGDKRPVFLFRPRDGQCMFVAVEIEQEQYDKWQTERSDPSWDCTEKSPWEGSPGDTYAINPKSLINPYAIEQRET
jgi:hypothetical protein